MTKKIGQVILVDNENRNDENARRFFNSFCAMLSSVLVLFALGYLIKKYVPNPIDINFIQKNFNNPISTFLPEQPEKYQYMVLTVLFPILFFILYFIYSKLKLGKKNIELFQYLYPSSFIAAFALFYYLNKKDMLYLNMNLFFLNPMLAIFATLLVIYLIYLYNSTPIKKFDVIGICCLIIALFTALFTAWLFITGSYTKLSLYNFDAYYDPVFQVYSGKTLVHDFNNLYGFYPYFFMLAFKIIGSISILKFSFILSFLVLVTCLSLLAVIWMNVKNKVLAMVGYGSLLFFLIYMPLIVTGAYYPQYEPHRLIFPSLILLAACLWNKSKKQVYKTMFLIIGYIITLLSIVWNTETGLVIAVAWCLFLIYCYAHRYYFNEKSFYIGSAKTVLFFIASVVGAFLVMMLITFLRCGVWPGIKDILFVPNLFYSSGFNMLPMKLFHPWILLVLVYALGLMVSIRDIRPLRYTAASISERNSLYFLIAILGMGIFSYYQGRSHDNVLTAVFWPGIIIVVFFAQDCIDRVYSYSNTFKLGKYPNKNFFITDIAKTFLFIAFLVSFALSSRYYIINNKTLIAMSLKQDYYDTAEMTNQLSFIRSYSNGAKNIDLIILEPSYYYTKLGLKNPTDLSSSVNWFLKSDEKNALDWLNKTKDTVFLDDNIISYLTKYNLIRFQDIMKTRFVLLGSRSGIHCYITK